jgi:hypothetical protein
MDVSLTYANQLKGLLAKADGKDKFIALLQYAAMFASAGEPGAFLAAQKSLSAARKPFRVFKPVEFLMPLVERPPKGKGLGACLAYVSVPPPRPPHPRESSPKSNNVSPSFPDNGPPRGVVPCACAPETKRMSPSAASAVSPLIHARLVL